MMVLAVLVFSLRRRLSGSRFRNTVGILAAIGLIMLTKSMTGALILALMFLVLNVGRILFWKRATKVTAVVAVAAALTSLGAWLITNWVSAMEALGRSSTLTGRISLFIICTLLGLRKPWLGYGFTGFWRGYDGPSAGVWKIVGWKPPNAHNGFLDIWLSLGLVGLAFFLAFFARLVWRTIAAVHFGSPPEALWPLSYVLFVFLYNIDETDLLQQNSLIWVLLVGACVSLSRSKWAAESLAEKTD